MARQIIEDFDDSRLDPYRGIVAQASRTQSELFVAEGQWIVERLLASRFDVESILIARGRENSWDPDLPDDTDMLICEPDELNRLVGFEFHRGIMAAARRSPMQSVPSDLRDSAPQATGRCVWLVCPRLADPQNLGSLIRTGAGLGAMGLILGPNSCDPYSRKCIRVSAGQVFQFPIIQPADFESELRALRETGYEWVATTPKDMAPVIGHPRQSKPLTSASDLLSDRVCLFLGSEDFGLDQQWLGDMDHCLHIPMSRAVDSLNVAIAGAILLYEICCRG